MDKRIDEITKHLYIEMPGAPAVPTEGGYMLWGEVEGGEYWDFCEAIAMEIVRAADSAARRAVDAVSLGGHP